MRRYLMPSLCAVAVSGLAACSSSSDPGPTQATAGGTMRVEAYCNKQGLTPTLRQTFIVVDERDLKPVKDGAQFAQQNASIRDAVLAFANPGALDNGRTSARERITLMLAPASGASPKTLFTGCVPGLTAQERADVSNKESKVAAFVSGGALKDLESSAEDFNKAVAASLVQAALAEKPAQAEEDKDSLFASLASTGQIFRSTEVTPRIVLVSGDFTKPAQADVVAARKAALDDASKAPVDFGNAEVIALGPGGNSDIARAWLQTYLLRMNGKLLSWSDDASGITPTPAPVSVKRYAGTAHVPGVPDDVIQIRVATDASGKLVNSWLVQTGNAYDHSIPLTGQSVCDDAGNCKLRSDNEGFAQAWVAERGQKGDQVQFDGNAPFGGLRQWTLETTGEKLTGKIFDSAVGKINQNGSDSVGIEASIQQKANF